MGLSRHQTVDKVMDRKLVEDLLKKVTPFRAEKIMEELVKCDFFKAKANRAHHLSMEGGLCRHSLNVCDIALGKKMILGADANEHDIVLASLLHDIEKAYKQAKMDTGGLEHADFAVKKCEELGLEEPILTAVRWHEGLFKGLYSPATTLKGNVAGWHEAQKKGDLVSILHLADMDTSQISEKEKKEDE